MKSKPSRSQGWNYLALLSASVFLLGALAYFMIIAFASGFEYGLRSLAACILPFIVMVYIKSFTQLFKNRAPNQNFNLFFIYTLWTIMLLLLSNGWGFTAVPLVELLFSITLVSILARTSTSRNATNSKAFACCYGVLTGLLSFICLFGLVLRT